MPSPLRLRLATLLFPPAGLWLLWRHGESRVWRKLLGTLGIFLYSLLYAAAVVFLLMQFAGLEVEWRGGFPPVLTFHKTKPDFDAVEAHRTRQTNATPSPVRPLVVADAYWTDFRGPNRDGHYTERPILTNWPAGGLRQLWRQPIGGGYASFVVADGLAFTIEQRRDREAVTAYEVATGREVWVHGYLARFQESMGGEGPRATPTWHDGRVYSLGAQGEFSCLDAAGGRLLWCKNILQDNHATNLFFALATAPLIVDDLVVVLSGSRLPGATNQTLLAFDKVTGTLRWSALDDDQAYTSPMLVTLAGQRQLLVVTAARAVGLRPENGAVLWSFPWRVQYDNSIAQPVLVNSNRFVLSAGYGTGAVCVEVSVAEGRFKATPVWRNKFLKTKFASAVFWQGHLYGLDEDILTCLDATTGERRWKDGRYGYGQLLLASGHLVMLCGDGDLALVRATPARHEELARVPALHGKTWNHPAIAGGRLLVRNAAEMACFDIGAAE